MNLEQILNEMEIYKKIFLPHSFFRSIKFIPHIYRGFFILLTSSFWGVTTKVVESSFMIIQGDGDEIYT